MFIDVARYIRPPQMNIAAGLSLAAALEAAAPKALPAPVQKAFGVMLAKASSASGLWKDEEVKVNLRPYDQAEDNGFASILGRLTPYEWLDETKYPQAEKAAHIRDVLFPDGLSFLKLPYKQEWAEAEKRFEQIKKEGLAEDLKALVGAEFVEAAEHAHAEYGRMLGITAKSIEKDAAALREPLRELARAISDYAVQLAAAVHAEENEEAAKALLAGLAPIDAVREWRKKRRPKAGTEEVVEPVVPVKPEGDKTPV